MLILKSMTGHLLGASGGIEAIATVMAVFADRIPSTINLDQSNPDFDLDYILHTSCHQTLETALSNSFGFGSHNITLAFKKFQT